MTTYAVKEDCRIGFTRMIKGDYLIVCHHTTHIEAKLLDPRDTEGCTSFDLDNEGRIQLIDLVNKGALVEIPD